MVGEGKKLLDVAEERAELDMQAHCDLIVTKRAASSGNMDANWLVVSTAVRMKDFRFG